jgi:uncharacterized membrane protein
MGRVNSITGPGIVFGLGFGGLFDGIVFHQILQWHHMLTSTGEYPATTVRGLEVNTLADGLFHAVTFVLLVIGVAMVWSRAREGASVWSWRSLLGWGLVGWGIFNLVEGIVDHHILQVHHVRPGPNEVLWDIAFLAFGVLLGITGYVLARSDRPTTEGSGQDSSVVSMRRVSS